MKKIVIVQVYNANKGNNSVVHAMINSMREDIPCSKFAVTAYDSILGAKDYGVECAECLLNFYRIKTASGLLSKIFYSLLEGTLLAYSFFWLIFYRIGIRLPLPDAKRKTINIYLAGDVFVLPGGHSFTSLNSFSQNLSHCLGLFFAIALNKKSMVYAQTIGPFFGRFAWIVRFMSLFVLKRVDVISVREKDSLRWRKELPGIELTAETVFMLDRYVSDERLPGEFLQLRQQNRCLIGLTIHHLYFRRYFSKREYVKLMANIIDRILEKIEGKLVIIPMENAYSHGGDRPIAHEIIALLKHHNRTVILEGDHDPIITSSIIRKLDLFIGTKTHSIVYGLKACVPTLAIAYQQKSNEFMEMFRVSENAINLKDLAGDRFMKIFNSMINNLDAIRLHEESALVSVREAACKNNVLLAKLLAT